MNSKKLFALCCSMLILGSVIGTAHAGDIETNVVKGHTYLCFMLTPLDIFNSEVTFKENGGFTLSNFGGYGFYISLTEVFAGVYYALDATIGTKKGDLIIAMTGISFDPFVVGAGTVVVQYSEVVPLVFYGFQSTPEPA